MGLRVVVVVVVVGVVVVQLRSNNDNDCVSSKSATCACEVKVAPNNSTHQSIVITVRLRIGVDDAALLSHCDNHASTVQSRSQMSDSR